MPTDGDIKWISEQEEEKMGKTRGNFNSSLVSSDRLADPKGGGCRRQNQGWCELRLSKKKKKKSHSEAIVTG